MRESRLAGAVLIAALGLAGVTAAGALAGCGTSISVSSVSSNGDAGSGPGDGPARDLSAGNGEPDLSHDPADAAVATDSSVSGCTDQDTFAAAQTAMLSSCSGFLSCHTQQPFGAGLDLTPASAWASLVNVDAASSPGKKRVVPGHPESSFLVDKLTDNLGVDEGNPMPQGEGIRWQPPDPAKLHVLECWIARGARKN